MDWVKMLGLFLLLCMGCHIAAAGDEKKGPDIDSSAGTSSKADLSKEGIMFGNQQNVPTAEAKGGTEMMIKNNIGNEERMKKDIPKGNGTEDSLKSVDQISGERGDAGTVSSISPKVDYYDYLEEDSHSGEESYVIFAPSEEGKDYQYDEPYALYRKRRDVAIDGENKRVRKRRKVHPIDPVKDKRNDEVEFGPIGGSVPSFSNDKITDLYRYLEKRDPRMVDADLVPGLAKGNYDGLLTQHMPLQVIGINQADTYNTLYGSTLPAWSKQMQIKAPPYFGDGSLKFEERYKGSSRSLEPEKEDVERMYELAMLLQGTEDKRFRKK